MERLNFRHGSHASFVGEFNYRRIIEDAVILSDVQGAATEEPLEGDHPLLGLVRGVNSLRWTGKTNGGGSPHTMLGYVADIRVKVEWHPLRLNPKAIFGVSHEATVIGIGRENEQHWLLHLPAVIDAEAEEAKIALEDIDGSEIKQRIGAAGLDWGNRADTPRIMPIIDQHNSEIEDKRKAMPHGVAYRMITASTRPEKLKTVLTVVRLGLNG